MKELPVEILFIKSFCRNGEGENHAGESNVRKLRSFEFKISSCPGSVYSFLEV